MRRHASLGGSAHGSGVAPAIVEGTRTASPKVWQDAGPEEEFRGGVPTVSNQAAASGKLRLRAQLARPRLGAMESDAAT